MGKPEGAAMCNQVIPIKTKQPGGTGLQLLKMFCACDYNFIMG